MTTAKRLFTIGYQGRSLLALCQALQTAGVTRLVDVRARAWSNRPEFRKTVLRDSLGAFGIEYIHCKDAGNPFRPKPGEVMSWKQCRALYRAHLKANPEVVRLVGDMLKDNRTALFCYEALRTECHRGELVRQLERSLVVDKVVDL